MRLYATWKSYQNAVRFADDSSKKRLQNYLESTETLLRLKAEEDAKAEATRQIEAAQQRRVRIYNEARRYDYPKASSKELEKAISLLSEIPDYLDASDRISACRQRLSSLREEMLRQQLAETQRQERSNKIRTLVCVVILICAIIVGTIIVFAIKASRLEEAEQLANQLIGKSFECSYYDSGDNYYYEPHEDMFKVPKTHSLCYINYSFQSANSIKLSKKTYTANNPYRVIDGEIQWDSITSDSEIINDFSVSVSFFGKATVMIDGVEFNLNIGRNGDLLSISDQSLTYSLQD